MISTTAICIPAMRPQFFERIVHNIAETTPEPHTIYWMVGTDEAENELIRLEQRYWRDQGETWGNRLTFMYHHTDEPYLFCAADDLRWHAGWLSAAMEVMQRINGVVSVNDQWQGEGTHPLISREYLDTMSGCADQDGVVMHPDYHHCAAESELFETARYRGRFAYCSASVVEHLHFTLGKSDDDDAYHAAHIHDVEDLERFNSRSHLWGR